MRFPRNQLIVLLAISCALTGCGRPKSFDVVRPVNREPTMRSTFANTAQAADTAIAAKDRAVWRWAAAVNERQPPAPSIVVDPRPVALTTETAAAPSSYNWDALSICETGADWTAHGSRYSSALGIMNQAVRENATEEVAARILSGTASREEQIQVAESIAARHGIRSWACWEAAVG